MQTANRADLDVDVADACHEDVADVRLVVLLDAADVQVADRHEGVADVADADCHEDVADACLVVLLDVRLVVLLDVQVADPGVDVQVADRHEDVADVQVADRHGDVADVADVARNLVEETD